MSPKIDDIYCLIVLIEIGVKNIRHAILYNVFGSPYIHTLPTLKALANVASVFTAFFHLTFIFGYTCSNSPIITHINYSSENPAYGCFHPSKFLKTIFYNNFRYNILYSFCSRHISQKLYNKTVILGYYFKLQCFLKFCVSLIGGIVGFEKYMIYNSVLFRQIF